jgi:lambda family phage tail tape measure protein
MDKFQGEALAAFEAYGDKSQFAINEFTSFIDKQVKEHNTGSYLQDLLKLQEERLKVAPDVMPTPKTVSMRPNVSDAVSLTEKPVKENRKAATDILQIQADFWRDYMSLTGKGYQNYLSSTEHMLDRQVAIYQEAGIDIVDIESWKQAKMLELSRDWEAGAIRSLNKYSQSAMNAAENVESFMTNAFQGIEDAMVQAFKTGKFSFSDMVDSMISDMIRLTVRESITGPLAKALSAGIGSLFSGSGGYTMDATAGGVSMGVVDGAGAYIGTGMHSGGIVGMDASFRRLVPASAFEAAERFHGGGYIQGLRPDERTAILQTGERVLSREETARYDSSRDFAASFTVAPQLSVIINNNAPVDVEAKQSTGPDGGVNLEICIDSIDQALAKRQAQGKSAFGKTLSSMNGLNFTPQLYRN